MNKDLLKEGIRAIVEEKIMPVRFVNAGWILKFYLIFDTTKQIGKMLILDEFEKKISIYKGFGDDLHPVEAGYFEMMKYPHWLDRYSKEDRKLMKPMFAHIRQLEKSSILNDENDIELDPVLTDVVLLEMRDDLFNVLSYNPHPYFKLNADYRKELLELIQKLMAGEEIEYYI